MPSESDYERFFAEADADGSGELTMQELINMLKKQGYKGSDSDIKAYFRQCDTSGDGKICKTEYMTAMGMVPEKDHKQAAMRSVFQGFDKDGSGKIDKNELKAVFAEMGKSFTDQELHRMIELADKDGSGTLEYEEFIAYCFGQ